MSGNRGGAGSPPLFDRQLLRMGSIAFLAGLVIFVASTILHPSSEDPTNHPVVFEEYTKDDLWIASHIGQFAGGIVIFAGGFMALCRLLVHSESQSTTPALAWIGFIIALITASSLAVLQAVDGIALKRAVDSWTAAPAEERATAFRIAEGIRWIEIGFNSIFRILQGTVGIIFGVAIIKSTLISKWIGVVGALAGVATIILGVNVAYVGFATVHSIVDTVSTVTYLGWLVILGIFMWRKSVSRVVTKK